MLSKTVPPGDLSLGAEDGDNLANDGDDVAATGDAAPTGDVG
jgi:hypothetical protein